MGRQPQRKGYEVEKEEAGTLIKGVRVVAKKKILLAHLLRLLLVEGRWGGGEMGVLELWM